MIELEQHIEALLLENDCVIVPGFGGFVAHYAGKAYSLKEAASLVKEITFSKFDASLDIDVDVYKRQSQ